MLLAGDSHGNSQYLRSLINEAQGSRVFVLGDFGIWPGRNGRMFLDFVSDYSGEKETPVYFLDGNHEDFTQLDSLLENGERDDEGFIKVRENILWAPRGHRWIWDGVSYMAVGGGYSIDKGFREAYIDWWPQETLTREQVEYAKRPGHVDIMLTHDCPTSYPHPMFKIVESYMNQQALTEIVDAVRPSRLYHGHMHKYAEYMYKDTKVTGLAHEFERGSRLWI